MISWLRDLIELIFPSICPACLKRGTQEEEMMCLHCCINLPQTEQHLIEENEFTEKLKGRVELQWGAAKYYFSENSDLKNLIHALKYKNRYDVGYDIGLKYGEELAHGPYFYGIDYIVPVPLHSKKLKQRSYNQSEAFARGLAHGLDVPCRVDLIRRAKHTESQTHKSRFERVKNMQDAFIIKDDQDLKDKHILVVDDVITTGSTLEACAHALEQAGVRYISMSCIAMAYD
jgi:ComF family protein